MSSYFMNKFTKIKKTLAVSVCSSMLFSGAPKTKGMDPELIKNFTQQIATLNQQVADLKKENAGKNFGISIAEAATWTLINHTVSVFVESISIYLNSSKAQNIYKKACYFLRSLDSQNALSVNQSRMNLNLARNGVLFAQKNNLFRNYNFVRPWYLFRIEKTSGRVEERVKSVARALVNALPDTLDNDEELRDLIAQARISESPEDIIESIFDRMIELRDNFTKNGLETYLNNNLNNLPLVNDVIHNVIPGGNN